MKFLVFQLFLFTSLFCEAQSNDFTGTYSFGKSGNNRSGMINIYPTSDSTYLFYLEVGRGAPSYNSGAIIGELKKWTKNTASFHVIDSENNLQCGLLFSLNENVLTISTVDTMFDCGYGFDVFSDGNYKRTSKEIPEYFIDREGKQTNFKDL